MKTAVVPAKYKVIILSKSYVQFTWNKKNYISHHRALLAFTLRFRLRLPRKLMISAQICWREKLNPQTPLSLRSWLGLFYLHNHHLFIARKCCRYCCPQPLPRRLSGFVWVFSWTIVARWWSRPMSRLQRVGGVLTDRFSGLRGLVS